MKALLLVLSSIFFASVANSQSELPAFGAEKIKVLSWNIYMLPGFLSPGKIPRAEAIGRLLSSSDYDVIVFQEAFHQKARTTISRLLQSAFPFQTGPANDKAFSLKTNSGLWIVSRHPISQVHSMVFNTRYGTDALSRKGALMIEIQINNNPVQIVGTHLQNAGGEWRRKNQCVELFDKMLNKYQRHGVPQIVCGDFNIDRHKSKDNYEFMLQMLNVEDDELKSQNRYSYDQSINDLQSTAGNQRNLIDYILTRSNQGLITSNDKKIIAYQYQWDSQHKDLSDHYSVAAEILYSVNSTIYTAGLTEN